MTVTNEIPLVFTVTETARLLGISRSHAYDLIAAGDLRHLRLGRRIVIPRHTIETLLGTPIVKSTSL